MSSSKDAKIELLPSRDSILRAGIDEKTLTLLVKEKVAEIMADRDAIVFEPFFRSRQIAYELKRLQTMPERQKWSVYFGRYGCLICETRASIHVGNGMCNSCYSRTFNSLKQIVSEGVNRNPLVSRGSSMETTSQESGSPRSKPSALAHRRSNKRRNAKIRIDQKP
ncbi:MAG: hypothetical protein ABI923_13790 [bacterium]